MMVMKRTLAIFLLFSGITGALAQPRPDGLSTEIVIDTDCGIDDMRAISLLLARPELTIRAILTSDGSLSPADGAVKVISLLHEFGKENIPVACGDSIIRTGPLWRRFNRGISWGRETAGRPVAKDAWDLLEEVLNSEKGRITLVCLGPLTSAAKLFRNDPEAAGRIERIIWYNDYTKPLRGFNYESDRESAGFVLAAGVRTDIIANLDQAGSFFDTLMYKSCTGSGSQLARVLDQVFSQPEARERLTGNHFRLCDDLVALYITNPELFDMNIDTDKLNIRYNEGYDVGAIKAAMTEMISGTYLMERNIVFNSFPSHPASFNYDVRPIIDSVLARYGYLEWKANVMTDEFHGHLGVFSIVGAKMGIKARELFGVGPDMLEVTSMAGSRPPYSCLNDGIQVSTGATLGMGTIHLAKTKKARPEAIFSYNNRSVRISLKKEYLDRVDADIAEGIAKFGLMDDGYWKLIRRNAIKYWLEWDRNKIFDIEEVSNKRQAPARSE
jgi:inosine-uridine nucleoside N-ribohydrolase/formylmethanofuran dehydrogenase subunit E